MDSVMNGAQFLESDGVLFAFKRAIKLTGFAIFPKGKYFPSFLTVRTVPVSSAARQKSSGVMSGLASQARA
jgi:hypothetical protein